MERKKVFVLYAPGGNGHKSAAYMIKETFKRRYPNHEVIVENAEDIGNSSFMSFALGIYDNLLKVDPKFVKYGYYLLNTIKTDKALVPLFPKIVERMTKRLSNVDPDIIVSVHSGINNFVVEAMKNLDWHGKRPFVITCTDMTEKFLSSWVHPEADLMIGFLEETRNQIIKYGMAPEKVKILGGTPVNPLFLDNSMTKLDARRMFGLQDDVFTVMIMSGGVGLKNIYKFTKQLVNSKLPVQMIVCCGRNEVLKSQIEKLIKTTDKTIRVFGFTNQIHNMMDASDIIVAKPGPGVIAEAIVKELPIMLDCLSEIMPQESGNVDYVIRNNVGTRIDDLSKFHNMVATFVYSDYELPRMRAAMKRLNNSESSSLLADLIVNSVPHSSQKSVRARKLFKTRDFFRNRI